MMNADNVSISFLNLFKNRQVNVSQLSRQIGIPYGTLYDIAKGKTKAEKVPLGTAIKLANAFGLTIDSLISATPDSSRSELLNIYDSMNDDGKRALLACGRGLRADRAMK